MFEFREGTPPLYSPSFGECVKSNTRATLRGEIVTFVTQVKEWRNQAEKWNI